MGKMIKKGNRRKRKRQGIINEKKSEKKRRGIKKQKMDIEKKDNW